VSARGDRYRAFLRSPEWAELRAAVKARAGGRCQLCGSPNRLEAHHRSYRDLADANELICLCRDCHELFHKHRRIYDDIAEDEWRAAGQAGAEIQRLLSTVGDAP